MINIKIQINDFILDLFCPEGFSLMQCLKLEENNTLITNYRNNILASCGGNLSCSSCVVKVHENFIKFLEYPSDNESIFLEIFLDQYNIIDNCELYRLSCQIILQKELNGMIISMIDL